MTPLRSIPARGAIGLCALTVLGLAVAARITERQAEALQAVRADAHAPLTAEQVLDRLDELAVAQEAAARTADAGESFDGPVPGPFGPLSWSATPLPEDADGGAPHPWSAEAVRARRPRGWVYPDFDEAPPGERHGPPPTPRPRNLAVRTVDANGEPLVLERLHARQRSGGTSARIEAFRASEDSTDWLLGSPSIPWRADVRFELVGEARGRLWRARRHLLDSTGEVDLELGTVRFEPVPLRDLR